jgi:hypothetical protein
MDTQDTSMKTNSNSTEELRWVHNRQMEISQRGCSVVLGDDRCSCEEPQSATEFFLTGPSDCACDCESC